MYYSELVRKAYAILWDAHRDDVDKGGYPYVFHPFYLATQMEDENSTCTALLHDVIEDHGDRYSLESLAQAGFPEPVLQALRLLTHADGVPYRDYVRRWRTTPLPGRSSWPISGTTRTPGESAADAPQSMTCIWKRSGI